MKSRNEAELAQTASLLLSRVREEVAAGSQDSVRQMIREVSHRAGVSVHVELLARDAWAAQERRIARTSRVLDPRRAELDGLAQAITTLRAVAKEAA